MTGSVVNHFRIEEEIGSGGMGTVYRAVDTRLGRVVAIKFLREELLKQTHAVERFRREARSISSLNHPNICVLYDIGEWDDRPYLIMEYLEGTTVAERLHRNPFSIEELVEVGSHVAAALEGAHSRGLVHRDIKPSNIFLTKSGPAKVLDFGIAKMREMQTPLARTAAADVPTATVTFVQNDLTRAGSISGTLPYMSPEQIRGEEIDARSDLFSLGATLYEMATGKRAFIGSTETEIAQDILHNQPTAPIDVRPAIPAAFNEAILTALEKRKENRHQSAAEMRAAFSRSTSDAMVPAIVPKESSRSRRRALIAAALLGSAIAGLSLYRYVLIGPETRFQRIEMSRLTSGGNVVGAAISPDGRYLAYAVSESGKQSFRIKQIANNSDIQITAPADAQYRFLTFSPDGNLVYYGTGSAKLAAVPTLGGTPRILNPDVDSTVTFSPDGKRIAFYRRYPRANEYAIFTAAADGTGERKIASRKAPNYYMSGPTWSPDGKTLICTAGVYGATSQYTTLVAIPADGGPERPFTDKKWYLAFEPRWLAHGRGVVVTGLEQAFWPAQIWYIPYPGGTAKRVTNDLNNYTGITLTADSSAFVTVQREVMSNIWVTDQAGKSPPVQVTSGGSKLDGFTGVAWTPDERIVYESRTGGDPGIWIMQADGSAATQLTGKAAQPRVTADGRYVVFASDRNAGKPHIWRMDLNGDDPKRLTSGEGEHTPDCCIDGKWVIYSGLGASSSKLWRVALDGGSPEPAADLIARFPIISPDSSMVAFNYYGAPEPPRRGVAVMASHGGSILKRFEIMNNDASEPHVGYRPMGWKRDSRALLLLRDRQGVSNVWEMSLDGELHQITQFGSGRIFSFASSSSGKRLAIARGSLTSDVVLIRNAR